MTRRCAVVPFVTVVHAHKSVDLKVSNQKTHPVVIRIYSQLLIVP